MSHTPDDKTLTEYLDGKSVYSARYREIPADDVPPELDEAILARAQTAAIETPAHKQLNRWRRWSVPATLAATFVLVVSLVIKNNVSQAPAEKLVTVDLGVGNQTQSVPAPNIISMPAPSETPAPKLENPPAQSADQYPALARRAQEADAAARQKRKEVSADIAEERAIESQYVEKAVVANELAKLAETVTEPVKPVPPAAPAPAVSPEPTPTAASAPPPPPAPVVAMNDSTAGATQPFQSGRASPALAAARKSQSQAETETKSRETDPKKWLEYIRQLRKDGKQKDADREWETFRKRYPDFAVDTKDTARPPER